jgi:hypothetical protein
VLSGAAGPDARRALADAWDLMRCEWRLPSRVLPVRARYQVLCHLDGHIVAPIMSALTGLGVLQPEPGFLLDAAGWHGDAEALGLAARILASQGWLRFEGPARRLTSSGALATAFARQYWHPVSYLPTLRRVPELLFGDPGELWRTEPGEEDHLDRGLDIRFSGDVFRRTCLEPFLDVVRPLFDQVPVHGQPGMVVDTGCGDGRLLEALYAAVLATTERGRRLRDYPLLMVGVEPSTVARRAASARLAAAGIPHVIIDGDIANPDAIGQSLARLGLDPIDALHVSKSVIHDRSWCTVRGILPPTGPPPTVSFPAFASPDGMDIPAARVALSLAEFFYSWRTLARKHGLLVIEAHTIGPETANLLIGRTLITELDATHGYSCQYPVEPQVFSWAATAAGWRSRKHKEPGADVLGHTILTIDHFVDANPGLWPAHAVAAGFLDLLFGQRAWVDQLREPPTMVD